MLSMLVCCPLLHSYCQESAESVALTCGHILLANEHYKVSKQKVCRWLDAAINQLQLLSGVQQSKHLRVSKWYHCLSLCAVWAVSRYTMIHHNTPWYTMIHHDTPWYTRSSTTWPIASPLPAYRQGSPPVCVVALQQLDALLVPTSTKRCVMLSRFDFTSGCWIWELGIWMVLVKCWNNMLTRTWAVVAQHRVARDIDKIPAFDNSSFCQWKATWNKSCTCCSPIRVVWKHPKTVAASGNAATAWRFDAFLVPFRWQATPAPSTARSRQSANALLGISVMWYQWWLSGLARRIMNN